MRTILLALLLCSPVFSQEFSERKELRTFTTTIEVELYKPITFKLETENKPGWEETDKIQKFKDELDIPLHVSYIQLKDGTFYCWAPPGTYNLSGESVLINWTKQDIDNREFEIKLIVRGVGPSPEPQPTPEPEPEPTPQPNNPFPSDEKELRVLLIEEQEERDSLSREQAAIFSSEEVRNYLDSKAEEWRLLDRHTTFTDESSKWNKALETMPEQEKFWIVISDGTKWESVKLPKNVSEMMTLLKKYGD